MKYPEDFINKLIWGDALEVTGNIPDNSIDLMPTDPPYGYSFMGRDWDEALVSIRTWKECLRVLKPGGFAFIMCAPRQDVLSRQIINLEEAGFITGFSSIYWAYASGFPKAQNISKAIDKKECRKQLIDQLERKPTKEEFEKAWDDFVDIRGRNIGAYRPNNIEAHQRGQVANLGLKAEGSGLITAPVTLGAKALNGSYGGFQPKPAVEVILVVMKPLSEKTYVEQALKNGKGVTWLDDGRIPYKGSNDFDIGHHNKQLSENVKYKKTCFGSTFGYGLLNSNIKKGRFPANLLISDDVLNDGRILASPKHINYGNRKVNQWTKNPISDCRTEPADYGSFSRYFDLDKWWEEKNRELSKQPCFICGYVEEQGNYIDADGRTYCDECLVSGDYLDIPKLNIKELPESVRKTYPYIIVPKASKSEKDRGCEGLETKQKYNKDGSWNSHEIFSEYRTDPKTGELKKRKEADNDFKNHHPTVKPIKLMSYLIILGSRPNDIILDPFVGSGTTCIAAKMLGRKYIGIDDDRGYVEIAQCRLRAIEPVLI